MFMTTTNGTRPRSFETHAQLINQIRTEPIELVKWRFHFYHYEPSVIISSIFLIN